MQELQVSVDSQREGKGGGGGLLLDLSVHGWIPVAALLPVLPVHALDHLGWRWDMVDW